MPAGTFNNVLAASALDSYYDPNLYNDDPRLGIDSTVTFGVTDVSWHAAGVGEMRLCCQKLAFLGRLVPSFLTA